jgi:hypothetical protein
MDPPPYNNFSPADNCNNGEFSDYCASDQNAGVTLTIDAGTQYFDTIVVYNTLYCQNYEAYAGLCYRLVVTVYRNGVAYYTDTYPSVDVSKTSYTFYTGNYNPISPGYSIFISNPTSYGDRYLYLADIIFKKWECSLNWSHRFNIIDIK